MLLITDSKTPSLEILHLFDKYSIICEHKIDYYAKRAPMLYLDGETEPLDYYGIILYLMDKGYKIDFY